MRVAVECRVVVVFESNYVYHLFRIQYTLTVMAVKSSALHFYRVTFMLIELHEMMAKILEEKEKKQKQNNKYFKNEISSLLLHLPLDNIVCARICSSFEDIYSHWDDDNDGVINIYNYCATNV